MAISNEEVVVRYRLEVDQLTKELDAIILKQEEIVKGEKAVTSEGKKQVSSATFAAQKRKELISQEQQEIRKLTQLRKLAFDPKLIEDYNKRIKASKDNISTLKGEVQGFGKLSSSVFQGIAAGIGAAFSIGTVIAFGKASIDAFLEAEESADKLKFAVTAIGGESEASFNRLLDQASELGRQFGISDESIQSAQASLASFGLSSNQIEEAIPALIDFATVTGKDIPAAAQALGQAIKGRPGEFKAFGAQVKETNTDVENFNAILKALSIQQGAAAKASETLTGQLHRQQEEVNELEEDVGRGLAPAWIAVKQAIFGAILGLIGFRKAQQEIDEGNVKAFADDVQLAAKKIKESGGDVEAVFTKRLAALVKVEEDATDKLEKARARLAEVQLNKEPGIPISGLTDPLEKEIKLLELTIKLNDEKQRQLEIFLAKRQQEITDAGALFTAEQLRVKETGELIKLLEIEGNKTSINAQSNVQLIDREIAARKKAAEEAEKLRQKEAEDLARNLALLRKLQIDNMEDLKNQRIAQFEDESKQITAKGQLRADIIKEMEIKLVKDLNKIDEQRNIDPLFRVPELSTGGVPDQLTPLPTEEFDDGIQRVEDFEQAQKDANEQTLVSSIQLVSALTELYSAFTNARLEQIHQETEAQLSALDFQQDQIEQNLRKRRISEKDAEDQTKALTAERIRIQEQAAAKERAIKRKQAQLDKINAIAQIAINVAQGISKTIAQFPNPAVYGPLIALIAALGAVQTGVVLSQPIPYKKGSKDTGGKGHMAVVGEVAPEFVWMEPHSKVLNGEKTKKNRQALDAMLNNRFDDYILKQYVTPALLAQKRENEAESSRSFSDNIARSIVIQNSTPQLKQKDSMKIANVEELAEAIVQSTRLSPYRRS